MLLNPIGSHVIGNSGVEMQNGVSVVIGQAGMIGQPVQRGLVVDNQVLKFL